MKDCIFCKMVEGEVEVDKILETDSVLAFLDANPVTEDHTLVIPKEHYKNIYDTPEEKLAKVVKIAKRIPKEYKKEKDVESVNLLNASGEVAGQSVFHFHLHVVPRRENDRLNMWFLKKE